VQRRPEATFVRIKAAGDTTNGPRRVLSMLGFSCRVLLATMRRPPAGVRRPDVVMGSSPHPFGALSAYLLARRYRVPFVLEVRDLWPDSLIDLLSLRTSHPLIRALRRLEVLLYRRASAIVGVLPGVGDHVRSLVPDAPPVTWVPNGVLSVGDASSDVSGDRGPGFTVLYAGAHGVPNSLRTLLDAAELIQAGDRERSAAERIRFVLVLLEYARLKGLTNVEFRPAVPKGEIPGVLARADVLAITWLDRPLYRHGISPNKLFDYFASGRPVVMALSSEHDPVSAAGAGLTVPAEDVFALAAAIGRLRDMPASERDALGASGRAFVARHHDIGELAKTLAGALEGALAGH
jgi:glycosyltransferase involved in cell wall biosynthesis